MTSDSLHLCSASVAELEAILARHDQSRRSLIPILQDLQEQTGYLPMEAVAAVAQHLDISAHEVFGVATFFSQFRFNPLGKHCLKICEGTACHVRGSAMLLDALTRKLHIVPGETTADREFSLERVMCLGSCALAPVIVSDDRVCGRINQKKLEKLLSNGMTQRTADDAQRNQIASDV